MSDEQHDIIDRIENALHGRGWSQRTLAERSGLSVTQMNRVMTRQRKLTATELGIIAEALEVSAAALLGESDRRLGMAARVGNAERKPELEGPFRRAEELLGLREVLDRVMTRPMTPEPPPLRVPSTGRHKDQGAALAANVRSALGLGNDPIKDLESVAAAFGLDTSTQPLPENLHGLLVADTGGRPAGSVSGPVDNAVALLNSQDTLGRRRFTLAHELGHLLFRDANLAIADYASGAQGRDSRWTPKNLVEFRANCFAKQLLSPDDAVRAVGDKVGIAAPEKVAWGAELVVELAVRFGLSFEMAGYRANDVGLLTDEERAAVWKLGAHTAFIDAGRGDDRAVLETAVTVEPPTAMLAQALTAYLQEMLGLRPLATLYDVSEPRDVERLRVQLAEAGWAPQLETSPTY